MNIFSNRPARHRRVHSVPTAAGRVEHHHPRPDTGRHICGQDIPRQGHHSALLATKDLFRKGFHRQTGQLTKFQHRSIRRVSELPTTSWLHSADDQSDERRRCGRRSGAGMARQSPGHSVCGVRRSARIRLGHVVQFDGKL